MRDWDANMIYSNLADDESRRIFEVYWNYLSTRDYDLFLDQLIDYSKSYRSDRWSKFKEDLEQENPQIVIWGAGGDGKRTYKLLKNLNENVVCFGDNNVEMQGKELVDGLVVYSIDDVFCKYPSAIQILASRKYCSDIYEQLLVYGFERKLIYYPPYRRMTGSTGKQYFDCPEMNPIDDEVFIDAGSYDGINAVQFSNWCEGKYKKIFSFDPDHKCEVRIQENINRYGLHDVEFNACALSNKSSVARFNSTGMAGAAIDNSGIDEIRVTSIDEVLKGEKATFIKMDIEGSEYEAIEGCAKTILQYHPRLAICIYHKPLDFIKIPHLILSIRKDYKFYIRHYTNCEWETVLYAI